MSYLGVAIFSVVIVRYGDVFFNYNLNRGKCRPPKTMKKHFILDFGCLYMTISHSSSPIFSISLLLTKYVF